MRGWIVEHAAVTYEVLLPLFWVTLAFAVVGLLPLTLWRKTRPVAAAGLVIASYIFGAATWFLGAAVTFGSFGWFGLIIGLGVLGIGVVPLAIIGAFFSLGIASLGLSLCVMLLITLAARFGGAALACIE